jgi:hypothetical protein
MDRGQRVEPSVEDREAGIRLLGCVRSVLRRIMALRSNLSGGRLGQENNQKQKSKDGNTGLPENVKRCVANHRYLPQ